MDDLLARLGLSDTEQRVYTTLLAHGQTGAGPLIAATKLKRGNTYHALGRLVRRGLAREDRSGGKTVYIIEHPDRLSHLLAERVGELTKLQTDLAKALPKLTSQFRLMNDRPQIQFFEGEEGIRTVFADSLTATTPIDTYLDGAAVLHYFPKINAEYVKKRLRLKKAKRILTVDSLESRRYALEHPSPLTEVRFLPKALDSFRTVMQIYDHKVSYVTLKPETMIGVIIEDELIAEMHRDLFALAWQGAAWSQMPDTASRSSAGRDDRRSGRTDRL